MKVYGDAQLYTECDQTSRYVAGLVMVGAVTRRDDTRVVAAKKERFLGRTSPRRSAWTIMATLLARTDEVIE